MPVHLIPQIPGDALLHPRGEVCPRELDRALDHDQHKDEDDDSAHHRLRLPVEIDEPADGVFERTIDCPRRFGVAGSIPAHAEDRPEEWNEHHDGERFDGGVERARERRQHQHPTVRAEVRQDPTPEKHC